jgi:ElaA protein
VLTWCLVPFAKLSVDQLYDLLKLRQQVFVVEQTCAYLDCDDKDRRALHLLGEDEEHRLIAYARIVPPGISFAEASIGRVVTDRAARRSGHGRALMHEAIARTRDAFGGAVRIGAQLYLQRFYESFGFVVASAVYDEDGIPHVEMLLA